MIRIDGRYQISMKTPLGTKKGELVCTTKDATLTGYIFYKRKKYPIHDGALQGNTFSFKGSMATPFGKMDYHCIGQVKNDQLTACATTQKGSLTIMGSKK